MSILTSVEAIKIFAVIVRLASTFLEDINVSAMRDLSEHLRDYLAKSRVLTSIVEVMRFVK